MIQAERIRPLNEQAPQAEGRYVLYWMQQSQRTAHNPALEQAIRLANEAGLPVLVGFGLTADYPDANRRHYAFMLQGLQEVAAALAKRKIGFALRQGEPPAVALDLARHARLVVCDRGYLRHQVAWRRRLAVDASCRVIEVEGDVVVPVAVASAKNEFAARTLRPKLHRVWDSFLQPLAEQTPEEPWTGQLPADRLDLDDLTACLDRLKLDHQVPPVRRFTGGLSQARQHLERFITRKLAGYDDRQNELADYRCSLLSPYLHFGQISPVEVALAARDAGQGSPGDRGAFLEELIVRRELSMNYVAYQRHYDRYEALPDWAQASLREHAGDPRPRRYDEAALRAARTHDPYWNAAMREMVHTGFMHNYMRMYWAKKILEWSDRPEQGFATTLKLNNTYFLDGRDPNSYGNVAWVYGLHDRPWQERSIFGKIRYMNDKGLERKFDMAAYIGAVDRLVAAEGSADPRERAG